MATALADTGSQSPLALPSSAPPIRPRLTFIGTALASVAVFMMFAGLIGVYLSYRSESLASTGKWLPNGASIPLTPANTAMFTLLLSVITMRWAVYAVTNNDRQHAYVALGLTMLFGLAFINMTTFLYTQMHLGVAEEPSCRSHLCHHGCSPCARDDRIALCRPDDLPDARRGICRQRS